MPARRPALRRWAPVSRRRALAAAPPTADPDRQPAGVRPHDASHRRVDRAPRSRWPAETSTPPYTRRPRHPQQSWLGRVPVAHAVERVLEGPISSVDDVDDGALRLVDDLYGDDDHGDDQTEWPFRPRSENWRLSRARRKELIESFWTRALLDAVEESKASNSVDGLRSGPRSRARCCR